MTYPKENPGSVGARTGVYGSAASNFTTNTNPVERFRQALPGRIRICGKGWRTDCPACDDRKQTLSFTEGDDGRLLLHCFKGCAAVDVLAAVDLRLCDVFPFRNWPESPEEKRKTRRAIRESGWGAALDVLAVEATIVQIAGRQLAGWQCLSVEDDQRLALAVERVDGARMVLRGR